MKKYEETVLFLNTLQETANKELQKMYKDVKNLYKTAVKINDIRMTSLTGSFLYSFKFEGKVDMGCYKDICKYRTKFFDYVKNNPPHVIENYEGKDGFSISIEKSRDNVTVAVVRFNEGKRFYTAPIDENNNIRREF